MSLQLEQINLGTPPLGKDGDTNRTANSKTNANMAKIAAAVAAHDDSIAANKSAIDANAAAIAKNTQALAKKIDLGGEAALAYIDIVKPAGNDRVLSFSSGASRRIAIFVDSGAETGGDAGSSLNFATFTDAGAYKLMAMQIRRSDGYVTIPYGMQVGDTRNATKMVVTGYGNARGVGVYMQPSIGGSAEPFVFANSGGARIGSITSNDTSVFYNTSSDYRLKQNSVPITGALDRVRRTPMYEGEFKAAPGKRVRYGIAHEIQQDFDFAVTGEKDAVEFVPLIRDGADPHDIQPEDVELSESIVPQTVDYSKLIPDLWSAVQELADKYDAALERIAALEAGGR